MGQLRPVSTRQPHLSGPPIFRRFWSSGLLDDADLDALAGLDWRTLTLPARKSFDPGTSLALVASGLVVRQRTDGTGGGQYLSLLLPGDPCSYAVISGTAPGGELRTVSECRIMQLDAEDAMALLEERPGILAALLSHMAVDAATTEELLVSISTRSALERMAHLLCELQFRLARMGLAGEPRYFTSLTQAELGRYLGLSAVHVNRTLQELRRRGCVCQGSETLELDLDELRELAGFDPGYLMDRRGAPRARRYDA